MKPKNTVIVALVILLVSAVPVYGDHRILDLMLAAGSGDTRVVKALLNAGVDVNARDSTGFTALMFAARYGHTDTVKLLLAGGPDVNAKSRLLGYTALMSAISSAKIIIIKDLLDAGADVNARNDDGITALGFAEELGDTLIVKLLKKHGALK